MLASRIARRNGFVAGVVVPGLRDQLNQCASVAIIENRTGSSTYFITADW